MSLGFAPISTIPISGMPSAGGGGGIQPLYSMVYQVSGNVISVVGPRMWQQMVMGQFQDASMTILVRSASASHLAPIDITALDFQRTVTNGP